MKEIVYLEKTDIGATLTTWIYCSFWQMWTAEQMGIDAYINWPDGQQPGRCLHPYIDSNKFDEEPNMFNWYFKQPKIEGRPPRQKVWIWESENWDSGVDTSPYQFMSQPLSVIRDYYKKHLKFSDVVEERGEALVKKYGLDFKNIIGITWRGTDNVLDGRPRMPIETYFPWIDDILEHNPYLRIMATAEEDTILDPLLARYPNAFKIEEFFSSPLGNPHNPERISPLSGFERGLQPALMVWLFSKCAHYIKNRSSTGAIASWLSDGRIVNLGHEETLSYNLSHDYAEIEGVKYPLNR